MLKYCNFGVYTFQYAVMLVCRMNNHNILSIMNLPYAALCLWLKPY